MEKSNQFVVYLCCWSMWWFKMCVSVDRSKIVVYIFFIIPIVSFVWLQFFFMNIFQFQKRLARVKLWSYLIISFWFCDPDKYIYIFFAFLFYWKICTLRKFARFTDILFIFCLFLYFVVCAKNIFVIIYFWINKLFYLGEIFE